VTGCVLELRSVRSHIVGCYGQPTVLDQLAEDAGLTVRVAPDELLCLTDGSRLAELDTRLVALDASGLAVNLSSAFSVWSLGGNDRLEAFSRLSQIQLPEAPAVLQGLVAHVPAKVIVRDEGLLIIVSSAFSHHLRDRVLVACADLAPGNEEAVSNEEPAVEEGALA
jgi:hypothetical protein